MEFNTSNRFAAHALSRPPGRAVAVLSYDKRGVGTSLPADRDRNFYYRVGMRDLVADAVEAVRFLSCHPRVDKTRIVVLGHSEGAIIMPLICHGVINEGLPPIKGCIFYSGFGESLAGAMALQRDTIAKEVGEMSGLKGWLLDKFLNKKELDKKYDDLLAKINAPDEPDMIAVQCGLSKQPAKWFREHFAYDDRAALATHVTCHCLAITGRKDLQVRHEFCDPATAAALAPRAASIEAHRPARLTHALRSLEGEPTMMNLKQDYVKMGKLPLDAELLAITDAWCDRILFDEK